MAFRAQPEEQFFLVYLFQSNKAYIKSIHLSITLVGFIILTRYTRNNYFHWLSFITLFYFHALKCWFRYILMTVFVTRRKKIMWLVISFPWKPALKKTNKFLLTWVKNICSEKYNCQKENIVLVLKNGQLSSISGANQQNHRDLMNFI